MFALNDYLLAGILFLALLLVVIDLWSFEDSRDFAKKRLSHYIQSNLAITRVEGGRILRQKTAL